MKRRLLIILGCLLYFLLPGRSDDLYAQSSDTTVGALHYHCWFDEDHSNMQSGSIGNGIITFDVSNLSEGMHSVNVQLGEGANAQLWRQTFYRIPSSSNPAQVTTYHCWFDEDHSNMQSGSIGNGIITFDVSNLSEGMHSVNVQLGEGANAQLWRQTFYRIPSSSIPAHVITYHCWFDEDHSNMQSGSIGNGIISFDVSNLSEGMHSVNVQLGEGIHAQLWRQTFYKSALTSETDTTPISYTCWFDEDYSTRQTGILTDGIITLNTSQLDSNMHTLYMQLGNGSNALLTYHFFWNRIVHQLLYDDNISNGTISITSTTDSIIAGHYVYDNATITINATPDYQYILQHLIVNGDTVTLPYTLTVTNDVEILVSFIPIPPDLQVSGIYVPDTIILSQPFTVRWMLHNEGTGNINNRNISDRILYNGEEVYTYTQTTSLNIGDSLERQATITLPCTSDPIGRLCLITDIDESIVETDETNNIGYSQPFTIVSPQLSAVTGMVPTPDSVITRGGIVLRWDTVGSATNYLVYVWPNGQLMPTSPTFTTGLHNIVMSDYENNQVYSWKVDAVNLCDTASGMVQHFAIFKQPALALNSHSLSFGEVEYNTTARESLHISGRDLTDSIVLSLHGTDSAMFSISSRSLSRYGGSVDVTFTPTIMKRSFDAVVAVQSGSLRDSILLSGLLANYYTFTVNVPDSILPPATPVPITGSLTNAAHVPQANVPVDIWVSVMGRTIVVTDTTDSQGHFSCTYTPVVSECGYYEVGACPQGSSNRNALTSFNIPGISINETALPIWEVVQYDTVTGSIPIKNRCGVTLHNVSVGTISLPTGLHVEFDTLTLAPFQEDTLHYTIIGTVQSTGTRYESVGLSCNSMEGNLARINLNYYCHKPIPNLQISFDSLFCSVVPGTQKIVDAILYNNTDSIFSNVQIQTPSGQSVVSLLQTDTAYSIAPHDSLFVHLLVSVPEDASWGIATGDLWVTADNTQPQFIPYTINPASDETGNLLVLVSNEYTYYNNGPHVSGATVTVVGYYSLDTVAVALTGNDGMAAIDSLPEGYYKVYVSAPENSSYSKITRITAGETTYLDIDLEYEAITYQWVAYQVDEEDNWDIVLNTEFKTNVPKPVITIDVPKVEVPFDGSMGMFNIVVSNHGLIDSYDATIQMPESSLYDFFPLFDKVDTLHALSSIVVPCGVRNRVIYDSVEGIKNRGNYYIDTVWSFKNRQQVLTTYRDSTILVPVSSFFDESTMSLQYYYDTIGITIPCYSTATVIDSTISHIVYMDVTTDDVLLDIDMNPQSSEYAKSKNQSLLREPTKTYYSYCEGKTIYTMKLIYFWWCNTATKKKETLKILQLDWWGKTTYCNVQTTLDNIQSQMQQTQAELVGEEPGRDCPFLYGRMDICFGRREHIETRPIVTDNECKPCWDAETSIEKLKHCFGISSATLPQNSRQSSSIKGEKFGNMDFCPNKSLSNASTPEEYKTLITIVAQYYYYQQSEFYRMINDSLPVFDDKPEILSQIAHYLNTTDSATIDGLAHCYDTTVSVIDTSALRRYVDRWNRTLTYSRYGWTRPEQVLPGFSLDFYYPDSNNLAAIAELRRQAALEGCESVEELFVSTLEAMKNHKKKTSTCASVSLQFKQNVAMTREAFEGRLSINNPNDTASIQNFTATFTVTDSLGHDCTDRFDIRIISREGIDSTGNIAANSSGVITVRFVPLMSAAPTDSMPYLFGGDISYINPFTSLPKSDELNPVRLTVHPCPHLQLDYFVPHDIIADDPLTSPIIEPGIPATIGMRLFNDGYGIAKNVRVSSISPQITENRQGLLVDFSIIGTMLNGANTSQPLNDISLGTVTPNQTHTFEYSLLSSLLGTLTVKDINVIHNSSIDDKDMSLVDARAHRLVKPILQYGPSVDTIHDFLTDDIGNGYNLPDSLFFSDGTQTRIVTADTTTFDHYVSYSDTVVQVTLYPDSIGWNYGETDDPGKGKYEIVSCIRDDNTEIPLENIWLTFVDLPTGEDPVYVNKMHLVDTLTTARTTVYNVTFRLKSDMLEVDTIALMPLSDPEASLDSFMVVFNKPIIDNTFSYADMSLKCNNGQNLMDNTIPIRRISDSTFIVDVSHKTTTVGLYVLKVMADSIVDSKGHYGNGGKEIHWVRTSCTPHIDNVSATACNSYLWRNRLLTQSGVYFDTVSVPNNCDSIYILTLSINHNTTATETVTACDNYTWHGTTYATSTNTPTYTSTGINGCDSVTTLHLTVNYSNSGTETVTACDSYSWHGTSYTTSTNTPTYSTTNAHNCDSTVTLHLTINNSTSAIETATACDSYTWHGTTYTASTITPTYTSTGINGCDSVTTLHLTVNYSNSGTETVTACDSYTWHGTTYTTSTNTPTYSTTNAIGCDSTVSLHLTINNSTTATENVTACDTYTWHGTTYTASTDTPTYSTTNANGCDSTVTLHLTVNHSNTGVEEINACNSYTWHGTTYTVSTNTPTYTSLNAVGCDSVTTLHLTISQSLSTIETITACDSYTWHGNTYTTSTNTPIYSTTTIGGCDSTITLHLTINNSTTGIETVNACDSYSWHGIAYTASTNTPTYSTYNANGCDSTITLHLTINNSTTATETITACDSYTWHGTNYTASTNTPTYSTTNANGCDSTVTLHLTINNSTTAIETATACDSYTWHGIAYNASTNSPTFSTTNAQGCDSTVTLHLTINYSTSAIETATACDSYTWHDSTYTASTLNSQFSTLNSAGCDSTVTLYLTINNSTTAIETATACDSYTWHDSTYTASTLNSQFSTLNSLGCDSTVTLNLTINYSTAATETVTACDTYTWNGTTYVASTNTPTYTSTGINGCDSVTSLHLTINFSNTGTETVTACDSYTWHDSTYTASTLNSQFSTLNSVGCDSTINLHLTINYSTTAIETATACDSYTWHDSTYTASTLNSQFSTLNSAGCDSTITLHLTINHSTTAIETVTACDSYTWHDSTYTASTLNSQYSTLNSVGCDSTVTLHLTINYSTRDTIVDSASGSYTWNGTTFTESGEYLYQGQTDAGCDSIIVLQLTITEVGIDIADSNSNITLFPNPTTGKVTINADNVAKVEVFDPSGRMVAIFHDTNEIDIHNLPSGAYTLRITLRNGTAVKRVVKQ